MSEDQNLIRLSKQGSREAFDALFSIHGARLHHFAVKLSGNRDTADDLVQDAFLAALSGVTALRNEGAFFTWLCGVVIRRHRDVQRKSRRDSQAVEDNFASADDHLDIDTALSALKTERREAFILVKVFGLTHAEAAQAMKRPEGTVKWLCSQAIAQLQESLKESYPYEYANKSR